MSRKFWTADDIDDFKFIPVPRVLATGFKDVSLQAKWTYTLLLNRLNLSRQNADKFSDKDGLFLYFQQDELAEMLGVNTRTVQRVFKELRECGLVETKSSGLGKPQRIYITKLSSVDEKQTRQKCHDGHDKSVATDTTKMSSRARQKCRVRHDSGVVPDTTRMSSPIERETEGNNTEGKNTFRATPKNESRFKPPTVEEVQAYITEKGFTFSAEEFVASNEQKGWVVGRNQTPMKNWKAACTIWQKNQTRFSARDKPQVASGEDLNKKWGILNYDEYLEKEQENGRENTKCDEPFGGGLPSAGFGMFPFEP